MEQNSLRMEPSIMRLITLLARKNQIYLSGALAKFGLTAAEEPFFMALYHHEGVTQEELTGLVFVDKAVTTRVVKSLEAKGLLFRVRDQADQRCNRIYPTQAAKEQYEAVHETLLDFNQRLVESLSEEDRQSLDRSLRAMQKNMNEVLTEQKGEGHGSKA